MEVEALVCLLWMVLAPLVQVEWAGSAPAINQSTKHSWFI